MNISVVFLPMKIFRWYNSLGCAPDMYFIDGDSDKNKTTLDKYISHQLQQAANSLFNENIKLIGYDYKQINKNCRSYYPMYAVADDHILGIRWITWKSSLCTSEYFILRQEQTGSTVSSALPEDIRFCTDEETAELRQFEIIIRREIILGSDVMLRYTKWNIGENFGFTFYYEFAYQITEKLIELTGVKDLGKLAVFSLFVNAVDSDGWTYSSFSLIREPEWIEPNKQQSFLFRWRYSKGGKGGYIHPNDDVNEGDIVFELCTETPECMALDTKAAVPSKPVMLKFLENDWLEAMKKESDEKELRANSFKYQYKLYVYCNEYTVHFPMIHLKIQFDRKRSAKANIELFSKIEKLLSEYGISGLPETLKSNPYCHGWNKECSSMELIFSFQSAPQSAVIELLRLLDKNGKNIKYIDLRGVTYESLSEDISIDP